MIRFVARTYPPCWVIKARIQKHRGKPLLFHDKCPGFFYVYYTTHGTYTFTSYPKDEAIMVKCIAQGHKRRDRLGRDSNSHSGNTRTWVQCTRPLGHNTPWLWLWCHVRILCIAHLNSKQSQHTVLENIFICNIINAQTDINNFHDFTGQRRSVTSWNFLYLKIYFNCFKESKYNIHE